MMQPGARIRLVYTNDEYTKLVPGSEGTVKRHSHDPNGPDWVSVAWDDGSSLTLMEETGDRWEEVK